MIRVVDRECHAEKVVQQNKLRDLTGCPEYSAAKVRNAVEDL